MADPGEFVGTQEAAKRLGVSVRTVQLWVEKGTLEAWKTPGGHRRIFRASVDAALKTRSQTPSLSPGEPLQVLIVEDDVSMQAYYRALFEILRPDAEITVADDGFEGLVALGKTAPNLMLVDVDMPGMDGITMLRRINMREIRGAMTIAVVTGLSEQQIELRGGVPTGIPVFAKPLSVESLSRLLADFTAPDGANRAQAGTSQ